MEEVRLTQPIQITNVRMMLQVEHCLYVVFAAQMTRHQLLLVSDIIPHVGAKGFSGYHYVSLVEFGGSYPLQLHGCLCSGYVQEKLRIENRADATNITAFLNALGHPSGARYYLENIPLIGDHVDHSQMSGGGLHVQSKS